MNERFSGSPPVLSFVKRQEALAEVIYEIGLDVPLADILRSAEMRTRSSIGKLA